MSMNNRIRLFFVAAMAMSSVCIYAQPERPVRMTPEERAERRTDEMEKAVGLDSRQYKKIYRIYLKEENAKEAQMADRGPMGPPPQGGPGGQRMEGPGAGGPPPGGMHGSRPPQGGPSSTGMSPKGDFTGQPRNAAVGGKDIDSDEYIDAREAKFRKILSSEQYATWRRLHPDPTGFFMK